MTVLDVGVQVVVEFGCSPLKLRNPAEYLLPEFYRQWESGWAREACAEDYESESVLHEYDAFLLRDDWAEAHHSEGQARFFLEILF